MTSFFKTNGKPTVAALSFAENLEAVLKAQSGAFVYLFLKHCNQRGAVLAGEHNTAVRMLQNARIKFWELNDSPRGDKIGDYISLRREDAQALLDKIKAAN